MVFVATAVLPVFPMQLVSSIAEFVTGDEPPTEEPTVEKFLFWNAGAFTGLIERPLLLGSMVAGHPEFIGVWLVYKGIAAYRLELKSVRAERRVFQLHLLNTAMSLGAVGLGWMVWKHLWLPTL